MYGYYNFKVRINMMHVYIKRREIKIKLYTVSP